MKTFRSYKQQKKAVLNNETTCFDITKAYLQKIKKEAYINAFVEVFDEECLKRAIKIDAKIKKGKAGKLAGMVIGIKDNICFKDHEVAAASKILRGFKSLYSATVVKRLLEEDALIIGRLNCDEFAMGSANENTIYGPVKNPHDTQKVAGGSSGGCAAAVSAGLCLAALGSDTGGSIRQPSAFCGVIGLKPTYSRVSRYGLIAYSSSCDQIGPITNTIYDAGLILEVIAGHDINDNTSSTKKIEDFSNTPKFKKPKKIAYLSECINREGLHFDVKNRFNNIIHKLKKRNHIVEQVSFPYLDFLVPTYYVITTAEASSNLARYDGVHYGYRSKNISDLESTYINSRTEGFGLEVKRRIMLGTFVLSAGYSQKYFTKAQKIRKIIQEKTQKILQEYDFVISPTTPHTAFKLGEKYNDPTAMYLEDIFTVQANLSGNPAISIPSGKDNKGMPIGIQLMGNHFKEKELLAFSKIISNLKE